MSAVLAWNTIELALSALAPLPSVLANAAAPAILASALLPSMLANAAAPAVLAEVPMRGGIAMLHFECPPCGCLPCSQAPYFADLALASVPLLSAKNSANSTFAKALLHSGPATVLLSMFVACVLLPLPTQSVHLRLCLPCWQILLPPQSLQLYLTLPCWQMPLPQQSLHLLHCLPCSQLLPPLAEGRTAAVFRKDGHALPANAAS